MARKVPELSYPKRKISETLLEFAAPMLRDLSEEAPADYTSRVLTIAHTVWNAAIFADVAGDPHYLDRIRKLKNASPGVGILTEQMIARKHTMFGNDGRLIGRWGIRRTVHGFKLWAEARDPRSWDSRVE